MSRKSRDQVEALFPDPGAGRPSTRGYLATSSSSDMDLSGIRTKAVSAMAKEGWTWTSSTTHSSHRQPVGFDTHWPRFEPSRKGPWRPFPVSSPRPLSASSWSKTRRVEAPWTEEEGEFVVDGTL